jgi:hypothetical protein
MGGAGLSQLKKEVGCLTPAAHERFYISQLLEKEISGS